jgi:hypothetical protein
LQSEFTTYQSHMTVLLIPTRFYSGNYLCPTQN